MHNVIAVEELEEVRNLFVGDLRNNAIDPANINSLTQGP